jgi:ABC-2 type transport system permease protein
MKNFSGFAALLKKELIIYFAGPIFYITGFCFLLLTGYFFYANTVYYGITSLAAAAQATNPQVAAQLNPQNMVYQPLFMVLAIILMFLVPLLTMRLLAEEKRSGPSSWASSRPPS